MRISEATRMHIYIVGFGIVMLIFILMLKNRDEQIDECLPENNHYELVETNIETNEDSITICMVEQLLKNNNMEHWEIVLAQIILESGRLTSNLSKTNNNLLGMKHPRQRPTTSLEERNGYAYYSDWQSCVFDYMIWQSRYAKKLSVEEYYQKLEDSYAEDKEYVNKLKEIVNGRI